MSNYNLHKHALILCNYGYGNVIMILPILAALEKKFPSLHYFCTDHDLFHNKELLEISKVRHLEGFVKPTWRRFKEEDVPSILKFISSHNITLIINMRLEAPDADNNYFLFKEKAIDQGITCWDLHDFGLSTEIIPVSLKIQRMFSMNGAALGRIDNTWLQDSHFTEDNSNNGKVTVSFHTGASQFCKRWPPENWTYLINQSLSNGSDVDLYLFSGIEEDEKEYAQQIRQMIDKDMLKKCSFIIEQPIDKVFSFLAKSNLIVTHDTFVSHFAAACSIPAVVLYTVTDGRIWKPMTASPFASVQSPQALHCSEMKIDGTCKRYYSKCNIKCSSGVNLTDVKKSVQEMFNKITQASKMRQ